MIEQPDDRLLHITAQYISEFQAGKQPRLSEYLARYPQYAEAIADFVTYYHLAELQTPDVLHPAPALSETSHSILESLLADDAATACSTLLAGSAHQHLTLAYIARKINLSPDIIELLAQRSIDPGTIPDIVISRMAAISGYTKHEIQLYLADMATLNTDTSHRKQLKIAETGSYDMPADDKPARPSFRQIIESSDTLTAEQKAFWLALTEQEDA